MSSRGPAESRLKIISGGQTGVDRAALDLAIARGFDYGGWCPKGGWAEDLPMAPGLLGAYPHLCETPLADPAQRTEWNVRDSDATLILVDRRGAAVSRGTALAEDLTARYGKPLLVLDIDAPDASSRAAAWIAALKTERRDGAPFALGIGGPRESEAPGLYAKARALLGEIL